MNTLRVASASPQHESERGKETLTKNCQHRLGSLITGDAALGTSETVARNCSLATHRRHARANVVSGNGTAQLLAASDSVVRSRARNRYCADSAIFNTAGIEAPTAENIFLLRCNSLCLPRAGWDMVLSTHIVASRLTHVDSLRTLQLQALNGRQRTFEVVATASKRGEVDRQHDIVSRHAVCEADSLRMAWAKYRSPIGP